MNRRFEIRLANDGDSGQVLILRNEPLTRAMSRINEHVKPDQHAAWYAATLADPNRVLFVAHRPEKSDDIIGVCRFDINHRACEVETSIYLAAEVQGQRLSVPILSKAIESFETNQGKCWRLVAQIRPENISSRRLFAACGFVGLESRNEVGANWYVRECKASRPC